MPDLGNVWHIPNSPEPRGLAGMRDPVGAIVPGTALRVVTGNQFLGNGGTPGNQLQDGSLLFFKTAAKPAWHQSPFLFFRTRPWPRRPARAVLPASPARPRVSGPACLITPAGRTLGWRAARHDRGATPATRAPPTPPVTGRRPGGVMLRSQGPNLHR
jgi:hypothetical protein